MQSCARRFLALMYRDVLYAGFAGAKTGRENYSIFASTHISLSGLRILKCKK